MSKLLMFFDDLIFSKCIRDAVVLHIRYRYITGADIRTQKQLSFLLSL